MKQLIFIILVFISICSFGQDRLQWGYTYNDTLELAKTDTLYQYNFEIPTTNFTTVVGINYGDIDSATFNIFKQVSIPDMGWVSLADSISIDSTTTDNVFYWEFENIKYPEIKFVIEKDTVDTTGDAWLLFNIYTKKSD